jgi:hypothetical protein
MANRENHRQRMHAVIHCAGEAVNVVPANSWAGFVVLGETLTEQDGLLQ